jgi:hypothetical protein
MDQSNFDDKYLRSIIRKWIELMPESLNRELFKRRIITSKNSLKRSSEVLLRLFEIELCKVEKLNDNEMIINILPEDKDIAFMLLSRVLRDVGCGSEKLIRTNSLEQLYNNLQSKAIVKSTLGGCLVVKNKFGIKITKEKRI